MRNYDSIIELLAFEGPGLQDFVSPEILTQLIDGNLAPGVIADEYTSDKSRTSRVTTDRAQTRADLLVWIRLELENAVQQRKDIAREEAAEAKVEELRMLVAAEERLLVAVHQDKLTLTRQALDRGATKSELAHALKISRPTLDKWLGAQ